MDHGTSGKIRHLSLDQPKLTSNIPIAASRQTHTADPSTPITKKEPIMMGRRSHGPEPFIFQDNLGCQSPGNRVHLSPFEIKMGDRGQAFRAIAIPQLFLIGTIVCGGSKRLPTPSYNIDPHR